MFIINTYLGKSEINGTGVFAREYIPNGSVVWRMQKNFDLVLNKDQYEELPPIAKDFIKHYGYYNQSEGGWVVCMDNAKYTNHSNSPNIEADGDVAIAIKDIHEGEEITEDYYNFDETVKQKLSNVS